MIVQLRFRSDRKCLVRWHSSEIVKYTRYSIKREVMKEKEFKNFADANGFCLGMQKRRISCELIVMGD